MNARPLHAAVVVAALAAALPLRAQQEDEPFPMTGASVGDNMQAKFQYDAALDLLKKARWGEGAKKLLELEQTYGDKLVRTGQEGQFVSARRLVAKIARELPPDGVAAWRDQVDPRVDAALASAQGTRDFRRILRDYPNATREPEVRRRLADALADAGDVEGEAEALQGLVDYPGDGKLLPAAAARLAFALGRLNDAAGMDSLEKRLGAAVSEKIVFRGKPATVREAIVEARKLLHGAADDAPAWAAWPMFGGSPSRDRIAAGVKGVPPPTARYPYTEGPSLQLGTMYGRGERPLWTSHHPESIPIAPAISDGIVLVSEGHVAWAAELAGDGDRRLWTMRGDDPTHVMYDERALHSATLAGGLGYFSLTSSEEILVQKQNWLVAIYPIPLRKLVCVEAQTGRKMWEKGGDMKAHDKDFDKEFEKRASFHGAPVVDGDRLYAAATYWAMPVDPTQHWVVCMDAKTGKTLWKTFIASGIPEINLFNNATRESIPLSLTVTGDRILTCTNLGVVACVDRSDGGMIWARRYPRFRVKPIEDAYEVPRNPVSWLQSPIYVARDPADGRDKVVLAPLDGPFLLVLSADDGTLLQRFPPPTPPPSEREFDDNRYLLGVRDGLAYISGNAVNCLRISDGKLVWRETDLPAAPVGRGLIASDGLYLPLRTGLQKLGLKEASAGKNFWTWPVAGMAGHLHFVDQAVVTSGNATLTICYDPVKAKAFLEAEIVRNPESAYLRYRLALCLLNVGENEKAEQALKKALELAGDRPDEAARTVADACRRTLFRNRMSAGTALLRKSDGARRAAEEYEKARPYASTEAEWLELLGAVAQARRVAGDAAAAVAAFQEIIEQHGDQPLENQEPARAAARRSIDALLAAGREPYAAVEKRAADLLERARRDNDPAAFEELTRRFPNSLAAEQASYGAGHARFSASDWPGACEALQKFLRDYPQSASAPQAMAELVVAFEKRGMWGMSGAQLRRMRKVGGEIRIDGEKAGASAWAERRLAGADYKRAEESGGAPAVEFPAQKSWTWNGQRGWDLRVLEPEGVAGWKSVPVLAVNGPTLYALDAAKGAEKWKAEAPASAHWSAWSGSLLVLAGERGATAYHEDGSIAWRSAYDGTHLFTGREAEGSIFLAMRDSRPTREDPRPTGSFVLALDAATGQTSWKADMQPGHLVNRLWVIDEGIAWPSRDESRIVVTDRETGAARATWPAAASRIVQAGPDRFLALNWDNEVVLMEASTGKTLWKAPQSGMRLDSALLAAGGVAVTSMTSESGGQMLRLYDLESGKLRNEIDLGSVWVKQVMTDGSTVYVAFKRAEPPTDHVAAAFDLATGKKLWQTPIPGITSMFPGMVSRDQVLLNCPVTRRAAGGPVNWVPTIIALDKATGKEAGRIEGTAESTPTYSLNVVPGRIVIAEEDTIEAWGK